MSGASLRPFHLAIPVDDLDAARSFYGGVLGCDEGRSAARWIDFDFFGHQLVCHLAPERAIGAAHENPVDGNDVPVPHFGVVLDLPTFDRVRARLESAGTEFVIPPHVRFRGEPGEQATMFLRDPAGNPLEFKAFADLGRLFAA